MKGIEMVEVCRLVCCGAAWGELSRWKAEGRKLQGQPSIEIVEEFCRPCCAGG